jgi:hypothetical protein
MYESGYGTVYLRWEKIGNNLKADIKIPPNTSARTILPGFPGGKIGGVNFAKTSGGAEAVLGSGTYSFIWEPV